MIDLTPLDVRKKRGDFGKALRGYDAEEVDAFLELVSERMEELVKENLQLSERTERLTEILNLIAQPHQLLIGRICGQISSSTSGRLCAKRSSTAPTQRQATFE